LETKKKKEIFFMKNNNNSVESAREAFEKACAVYDAVCKCKGADDEFKRAAFVASCEAYNYVIAAEKAAEKAIRDGIASDAAEAEDEASFAEYCEMCDTEFMV
jgi:hypothetical protein